MINIRFPATPTTDWPVQVLEVAPAPVTPRSHVRALCNDVQLLSASLDNHTPQAVLEALADAHHHLVLALAAYRAHEEYQGQHRDDDIDSRHVATYRDNAERIFGTLYYGAHRP